MWKLVRLSLAYHRKALLWTLVVALLLSTFGLLVSAIVGFVLLSAEDKERRLLLNLPLPVTRTQVAWARVVFPAMILVLGTLVATGPLSIAVLVAGDAWPFARIAPERLFFATLLMFLLQLLLTMQELEVWAGGRVLRTLMGGAVVVGLLGITILAGVVLADSGGYSVLALGIAGLTLGLMGLTVFLFQQRPSFTGG
jgi:hypothetical protein